MGASAISWADWNQKSINIKVYVCRKMSEIHFVLTASHAVSPRSKERMHDINLWGHVQLKCRPILTCAMLYVLFFSFDSNSESAYTFGGECMYTRWIPAAFPTLALFSGKLLLIDPCSSPSSRPACASVEPGSTCPERLG